MMLPSTYVQILFTYYPSQFERRFNANSNTLREFWGGFLRQPRCAAWASRHPYLRGKSVADLVCCVPCTLHTDAGPCTKTASCNVISFSGLLNGGSEMLSKFVICTYLKTDSHGDYISWERIVQDFDALASGVLDGEFVAKSGRKTWKCVLLVCKSDEEVKVNEFGFPSWASAEC